MHTHLKQFDTSALHQLRPEVSSVTQQLDTGTKLKRFGGDGLHTRPAGATA